MRFSLPKPIKRPLRERYGSGNSVRTEKKALHGPLNSRKSKTCYPIHRAWRDNLRSHVNNYCTLLNLHLLQPAKRLGVSESLVVHCGLGENYKFHFNPKLIKFTLSHAPLSSWLFGESLFGLLLFLAQPARESRLCNFK